MNYQTAAKAVELKNLIDKAHLYLPKIGRCLSLELEFKREYTDFEDEEGDDDNKYYTKKKQKIFLVIKKIKFFKFHKIKKTLRFFYSKHNLN